MMMKPTLLVGLALLAIATQAAQIQWTGYAHNNQWATPENWFPDNVPGIDDDVIINYGDIQATQVSFVKTLVMGANTSTVSLTIYNKFTIGSLMTVASKGTLVLASGATLVTGNVNIDGSLEFTSGMVTGMWTVSSLGVAHMASPGLKALQGCTFTAQGNAEIAGTLSLNASSTYRQVGTLMGRGSLSIRAEDSTSTFRADEAPNFVFDGSSFLLQAPARFSKFDLKGSMTVFSTISFSDKVTLRESTTVFQTVASARVTFARDVEGAGNFVALGNLIMFQGKVTLTGGMMVSSGTAQFGDKAIVDHFNFTGGACMFSADAEAQVLRLRAGSADGERVMKAASVIVDGAGFKVGMTTNVTSSVSVASPSQLLILMNRKIVVMSTATFTVAAPLLVTGLSGNLGIQNDGMLLVNAALTVQNLDLRGFGQVKITDQFDMTNGKVLQYQVWLMTPNSKFAGHSSQIQHITAVIGSPFVDARVGDFDLVCPQVCDNISTSGLPSDDFTFTVMASLPTAAPRARQMTGPQTH